MVVTACKQLWFSASNSARALPWYQFLEADARHDASNHSHNAAGQNSIQHKTQPTEHTQEELVPPGTCLWVLSAAGTSWWVLKAAVLLAPLLKSLLLGGLTSRPFHRTAVTAVLMDRPLPLPNNSHAHSHRVEPACQLQRQANQCSDGFSCPAECCPSDGLPLAAGGKEHRHTQCDALCSTISIQHSALSILAQPSA